MGGRRPRSATVDAHGRAATPSTHRRRCTSRSDGEGVLRRVAKAGQCAYQHPVRTQPVPVRVVEDLDVLVGAGGAGDRSEHQVQLLAAQRRRRVDEVHLHFAGPRSRRRSAEICVPRRSTHRCCPESRPGRSSSRRPRPDESTGNRSGRTGHETADEQVGGRLGGVPAFGPRAQRFGCTGDHYLGRLSWVRSVLGRRGTGFGRCCGTGGACYRARDHHPPTPAADPPVGRAAITST